MKKGFTLIELLAVIVILSVIALIATPLILNVVEESKKKASIESVNGIIDAAEKYQITGMLEGNIESRFEFPNDKLQYKGTKPESGTLIIDEEGKISITVKINGYCIRKRFTENTPSIIETDNCTIEDSELVYAEKYKEEILNGADPEIKDNLIPVTISTNGTVKYADIKREWYSYKNKVWANAVILKEGVTRTVGEIIPESDIKQYYVWIPRYKYQLWNVNGENKYPKGTSESAINIVFENKETEASNGTQNGEWLTHPAFTSFNTNGIWVGKYETSYDEETYTDSSKFLTANPNYAAATKASNIIIKPNVRSLTMKSVSESYILGRGVNENLNSHMMKNSEWGAVTYLTYSLFGKCTEDSCEEIYINNINTGYRGNTAKFSGQFEYGGSITGCSGSSATASVSSNQKACAPGYAYNEVNNKASTTGNISGIYDMSGGAWEYVMGVIKDINGKPISGRNNKYNSGFNGTYGCPTCGDQTVTSKTDGIEFPTDTRYYDLYEPNSTELGDDTWYKYENGHLGDGTKEITVSKTNSSSGDRGIWYQNYTIYPTATYPWISRGGSTKDDAGAGLFYFNRGTGGVSTQFSSRVVLAY